MQKSIVTILMERDLLTQKEAEAEVAYATKELYRRILEGEDAFNICEEYFGLEPDYLDELI